MDTYFYHGKTRDKRRFTLGGRLGRDNPGQSESRWKMHVSVAICGRKDNFSKKIGRDISMGRILKGKNNVTIDASDPRSSIKAFFNAGKSFEKTTTGDLKQYFGLTPKHEKTLT